MLVWAKTYTEPHKVLINQKTIQLVTSRGGERDRKRRRNLFSGLGFANM